MAATPPTRDADGKLTCPDCFGPVWDNRKKKADGTFNEKSPDFACKDKDDCDYAYWLEPPKGGSGGGRRKKKPPQRASGATGGSSGGSLATALYNSHKVAARVLTQLKADGFEFMADEAMVPEFARHLFDAHVRSGRPLATPSAKPKKKKKKPKPPPPPPEEDEDEEEYGVPDDDLPF